MLIDTSSSDIYLFQNVTLKIQDQGHSSRSYCGSYILNHSMSIGLHIPEVQLVQILT